MNWSNMGRATIAGLCLVVGANAQATGTLYAGFGGTSDGVSTRSSTTLTEIGGFPVTGTITGVEAGQGENLYITAGDDVTNFSTAGAVLATATEAGAEYSDVALLGANIFVTSAGATPGISARDLTTLVESDFFDTTFVPTSIEDGFGRLYVTANDTLFIITSDGTELANVPSGSAGTQFVGSAIIGTRLYAATGGSVNSVSVRNPITLAEITSFPLPFAVEGIVAGESDDLFITSGANIFRYSTAGVELDSVADTTPGRAFSDIAFIAAPRLPAAGTVLAITADGADSITARDAETLADAGDFPVAAAATGAALNADGDVILAAGDTLLAYSSAGTLLAMVTTSGASYADVAIVGGDVVAATATGLSVRDPATLAETSSVDLGFAPTSVTAASATEVYLTSFNEVSLYTLAGVEVVTVPASTDRVYSDVALVQSVVYATYSDAAIDAIAVLDPGSLAQTDFIPTPIAATGITAGGVNDYYISGGDTIVHYELDEVLSMVSAGAGTVFPDVVFSSEGSSAQTSLVAATLPGVRSVQVGTTASAFATVINVGAVTASNCQIVPVTTVAADFTYQTTDPGTNELVGTQNTPADIASAGNQSFLITFVPTAAFNATDIELDFICDNAPAAPSFPGLNTVLLVADDDPVADVIALASTPFTPGVIDVPGVGGTGFFAVASVNVGVTGDIEVAAVSTDANPAITLSICETNPATGACINPTVPTTGTVLTTIAANATPTFSIFASASAAIALDPAFTRVRVDFLDQADGTIRGATSVAIQTQ